MENLKAKYDFLCNTSSDINEHLPTLYKYAKECESVLELGVRGVVSTYAFTYGLLNNEKPIKTIFLNDITPCDIREYLHITKDLDIDVDYKWVNDLELKVDQSYDITFIDTWHVYGQLKRELEKFSKVTKKYIIMHDTTVDEIHGETIRMNMNPYIQSVQSGIPLDEILKGLWPAVSEFLENNSEWKIKERFTNNNGLTILEKNV
jgi:hypothetical protein